MHVHPFSVNTYCNAIKEYTTAEEKHESRIHVLAKTNDYENLKQVFLNYFGKPTELFDKVDTIINELKYKL